MSPTALLLTLWLRTVTPVVTRTSEGKGADESENDGGHPDEGKIVPLQVCACACTCACACVRVWVSWVSEAGGTHAHTHTHTHTHARTWMPVSDEAFFSFTTIMNRLNAT